MTFYDELQNVPIKELARFHNEQLISDESSDEDSEPENLPVFSLEQINALVVHRVPTKTQLESSDSCRRVAQKLSEELLSGARSKTAEHHRKISRWLEAELKTSDPEVTAKVYCAPCNLALNLVSPDDHYSSEAHQRCVELYCGCCQTHVSSRQIMNVHVQSKRHAKQNLMSPHSEYLPVLEASANTAGFNAMQSVELALKLNTLVGPIMCLICQDAECSENHRYSQQHIPNVLAWIQSNDTNRRFHPDNVAQLFCAACNVVNLNSEIALDHYRSAMHAQNAERYCTQCQRSFEAVQRFREHLQTIEHQKQSGAITCTDTEGDGESQRKDNSAECSTIQTEEATDATELNLQEKVLRQLEEITDKLLAHKTVSRPRALGLLRKLNAELAAIAKCESPPINCEIGQSPDTRLCTCCPIL